MTGGSGAPETSAGVTREPPTMTTLTGSGSLLETSNTARVGWPLTSLMPKISDCGNEALI